MQIARLWAAVWAVGAGAGVAAITAAPPADAGRAPAAFFDEPCVDGTRGSGPCRRALDHFTDMLAASRAGTAPRALRIAFIGDSLVGGDGITGVLRAKLGALIGSGGPGFVFAAAPHPWCRHRAVTRDAIGSWSVHGIAGAVPPDRLLGLGASAETEDGGAVRLAPASPIAFADVHYLGQPGGGTLEVVADGRVLRTLSTLRDHKQSEFARVTVPPATRQLELRAAGRVRLFGATLEAARGAVVDNLGVVSATVLGASANNQLDQWRAHLARRDADLVILMLGTNEAEWLIPRHANMADHERRLRKLLGAIRVASPGASCLVVSPLDQLDHRAEGTPPRASVPAIVEAQRRAATAAGCAFWDAYRWMGGAGSSRGWFERGLVRADFQHPTAAGAAHIAEALYSGLVR